MWQGIVGVCTMAVIWSQNKLKAFQVCLSQALHRDFLGFYGHRASGVKVVDLACCFL